LLLIWNNVNHLLLDTLSVVYMYCPCAACVIHNFTLRITKKAYPRSYCYYHRFFVFWPIRFYLQD